MGASAKKPQPPVSTFALLWICETACREHLTLTFFDASRRGGSGIRKQMSNCAEYDRLAAYVENVLGKLAQLTTLHLELFRSGDFAGSRRIDPDVERAVGEKERAIGALRQHMLEHKCQAREPV